MSATGNEIRELLAESLARFVERHYGFEQRNAIIASPDGYSADHWRQFAELGWLGAGIAETHGGLGGSAAEQSIIGTAFGRAMVVEPYVSTAVLCARVLELADNRELAAPLLAGVVSGDSVLALGFAEREARFDLFHQSTRATPQGNRFQLSGQKLAVLDAPLADHLIVAARMSGDVRDEGGIGLFLVEAKAPGVTLSAFTAMDGSRGARMDLEECPAELLVAEADGLAVLTEAVERATAVRCAQAAGAMEAGLEQTLEYVRTREQFGVPIGSFQVIQHRLVDLLISARECKAMSSMVASQVMSGNAAVRAAAVSAAKTFVGKRARRAAQEMVQLHGGIGMTEEYAIGHYFRYLTQFCSAFGNTAHHLQRYTKLRQ